MRALFTCTLLCLAGPALAADAAYVGTWSASAASCTAPADVQRRTLYVLHEQGFSVPAFGCERAVYRKAGAGWVVHASQCYGAEPTRKEPFTRDLHLRINGRTARISASGFDSGPLLRC